MKETTLLCTSTQPYLWFSLFLLFFCSSSSSVLLYTLLLSLSPFTHPLLSLPSPALSPLSFASFTSSTFSSFALHPISLSFFSVVAEPHHNGSSLPFIQPHFYSYFNLPLFLFPILLFLVPLIFFLAPLFDATPFCNSSDAGKPGQHFFFFKFVGVTLPHCKSFVCLREKQCKQQQIILELYQGLI